MRLKDTSCCAVQEIDELSSHATAKEAMKDFCKKVFVGLVKFSTAHANYGTIYSFYIFTDAVAHNGRKLYYDSNYGTNFFNFVKKHNLGKVWKSPTVPNKAFHSDHSNRVYVWMPDRDALLKWWEENK